MDRVSQLIAEAAKADPVTREQILIMLDMMLNPNTDWQIAKTCTGCGKMKVFNTNTQKWECVEKGELQK
jgi:hypothetical protein